MKTKLLKKIRKRFVVVLDASRHNLAVFDTRHGTSTNYGISTQLAINCVLIGVDLSLARKYKIRCNYKEFNRKLKDMPCRFVPKQPL